jgi:hypothetical protein
MFKAVQWRQESTWATQDGRLAARTTCARPALSALYCERMFVAYIKAFLGWLGGIYSAHVRCWCGCP